MGTTSRHGLPYPELTDPPDGPAQIKALAESIDTAISPRVFANVAARTAGIPAPTAGLVTYLADTGYVEIYQTVGGWSGWAPLPGSLVAILRHTTAQSVPVGNNLALAWHTEDFDRYGIHNATDAAVAPKVPGWYQFSGGPSIVLGSATRLTASWAWNNTQVNGSQSAVVPVPGVSTTIAARTTAIRCNGTTDYVALWLAHDSASAINTNGAGVQAGRMDVTYLGP